MKKKRFLHRIEATDCSYFQTLSSLGSFVMDIFLMSRRDFKHCSTRTFKKNPHQKRNQSSSCFKVWQNIFPKVNLCTHWLSLHTPHESHLWIFFGWIWSMRLTLEKFPTFYGIVKIAILKIIHAICLHEHFWIMWGKFFHVYTEINQIVC